MAEKPPPSVESRLADLAPERRKLLTRLLQKRQSAGHKLFPSRPTAREGDLPLSFTQLRLWLLDRLDPHQAAYNLPTAWRLTGNLNIGILAEGLTLIGSRHEMLRTTFGEGNGEPFQRISPPRQMPLPIVDLSVLPAALRQLEAARLTSWEAGRPFDLAEGPLIRAKVVRLNQTEHLLLLNLHQIIADSWSVDILARELAILYESLASGLPSPLQPLSIQYADYAVWQRQQLASETLEGDLSYWRDRLAGVVPLELPTDRPRSPVPYPRSSHRHFRFDGRLQEALRRLSQEEGATSFMALLTGVQVLLSRWTGQHDIAVGTLVVGRNVAELEGLIGPFSNRLTLRTDLRGESSFRELLNRTREVTLGAYNHQDMPFERLVEEIRPERDLTRSPLFQVLVTYMASLASPLDFAGLSMERVPIHKGSSFFDLSFHFRETVEDWTGAIEYRIDLFDAPTVERLALRLDLLLRGAVADPDQRIFELPILAEHERAQLLWEWNDTASVQPRLCLHDLFIAQAARTPEAIALIWGTQRITYQELDNQSNRLARRLRHLGVGPEVRVGVCLERSPDLVVLLLAVLKAGGAYVPLDPRLPAGRLSFLLENSGAALLVGDQSLFDILPHAQIPHFLLNEEQESIAAGSEAPLAPGCGEGNLAYIIYTSGSTGRPKGVAIEHRSATMLVRWASETFSSEELAGVLATTTISFDLSVFEIYAPLALGGKVILTTNPLDLPDVELFSEATLMNTVPALIARLAELGLPPGLRTVNVAGEQVMRETVDSIYKSSSVSRVLNLYGPSEDTTYSTCEQLEIGDQGQPSIGRPITGKAAFILDKGLELVPLGAPGEIWLGGVGLARGYLDEPYLTADRFRPNPFGQESGSRIYRTGDVARYRPDGRLDFLGRIDAQVKVRGFRIELGEIEAVLASHPNVRDAVVVVRQDREGEKRLAAYVVPAQPSMPVQVLREHLRGKLPEVMVPSDFVLLDALPLTPNGKLDRRALPSPDSVLASQSREDYLPPRTPVEKILAKIWKEVLRVDRISILDSFFQLGGDSILSIQVIARARAFGLSLTPRLMFESPTVLKLAEKLNAESSGRGLEVVKEQITFEANRPAETLASFGQQRFWLLAELGVSGFSHDISYNVPVSLRFQGSLEISVLYSALGDIVRRHEVLRATFALVRDKLIQRVGPQNRLSISLVDLQGLSREGMTLPADEASRLWDLEAKGPFDLCRGPLMRAVLLRLTERDHLLLVTFHHIVIDALSIDIFVRELEVLYRELSMGRPSPFADLKIHYSDYAEQQRRWMEGVESDRQLRYWKEKLAGAPEVLTFPTDRPRPPVLSSKGHRVAQQVEERSLVSLQALARRKGATIFVVLLAAFEILLRRYTGQQDLVVGTPIANRHWPETENIIGLFLNTVVLRNEISGNPSFETLLGEVRRSFFEVLENQDLPFEALVEKLLFGRSLSYSPLFQILVVHRKSSREGGGGLIKDVRIDSVGAKFDMTFSFVESEEGLIAECEYNQDLFDDSTARRIHGHLLGLIEGIGREPRRPILDFGLLLEFERHHLVSEWNDSRGDLEGLTVQERFAHQASAARSAPAVVGIRETLTYGELDERSARLARRLAAQGVGPDVPVAVLMDREPALVIGILAVLRAGGAYVPLDPDAPRERIAEILADLGDTEALVLVQDHLADSIPAGRLISSDSEHASAGERSGRLTAVEPRNLAYLLFTSGTSGRPKGVAVEHRNVTAFLDWAQDHFNPEERRAILASTSLTFDLSVFELFLPLTTGGCVVMVQDALALLELPRLTPEVTLINTVPSLLSVILESGELPSSTTTVNLAGEALQRRLVNRVFESSVSRRLLNLYGPTETTVYATVAAMSQQEKGEPSLGRPIRNAQGYVVNETMEIQPIGAQGELLLGGEGIARGYWRHPGFTAERFIPNPFSGVGSRLYRTGDLVRWLPDGKLEYLGRLDRQVKIRGLRIEPGDVEASLLRHPAVRDAVVAAKSSPRGEPQLVAYVKLRNRESDVRAVDLRAFLRQLLPGGLVPSSIVLTEDIPRTDRGKVDYKRLPEPDWAGEEAAEFIPPRSPVEQYLAEIWTEVLGVQHLSLNDDFFERGGHSLLAAQVAARLQQAGVALPLRRILEKPQLGQLAKEIEQSLSEREIKELAPSGGRDSAVWAPTRKEAATEPSLLSEDTLTHAEGAEMADLLREILEEKASVLKRRPYVSFPATCTLNAPVALHFQLVAIPPVDPLLLRLARLRVLQPACIETLFVKVVAPAFRVSPHLARMQVPADTDSTLLTFTMIPQELGVHVVEIEVFAGANRVSYFILETEAISYVN